MLSINILEHKVDTMNKIKTRLKEINDFLKSKAFTDKARKTYCSVLNKIFINIGLSFNQDQLENLFTRWSGSPRTYNLRRSIANFYTKKYLNYQITFTKAKVPKSLPNYATSNEFFLILKNILNFKHKVGISLMYKCGLRVSEVCRLKRENIDLNNQIITIRQGKGMKDRRTVIPNDFLYYLELYCKKLDNYLFKTYRGHISERSFEEVLKRAVKKANISKHLTCHDLRHSFAVNVVNKNIDIEELRKMLGHSKLTTTQIYLQCKTQKLTQIARCI